MKHLFNGWIVTVSIVLIFSGLLTMGGCATVARYGAPPLIENLGSLTVGSSTGADVLLRLGEPRGRGNITLQFFKELVTRDIWFYEYLETDGKNAQFEMLIVFMLGEIYDGHLWFSSFQEYEVEGFILASAPDSVSGGYFPPIKGLENCLLRGESSREEVLSILGQPTGSGSAVLPPTYRQHDILYYEDMQIKDIESVTRMVFNINLQQRILLVFLEQDIYDGFMWYTNIGDAEITTNF